MTKTLINLSLYIAMGISFAAMAEGVLIKSEPQADAEVKNFDHEIKLWFSGNVGPRYPSLVVADSQGKRVDKHDAHLVIGERSRLTASTEKLAPGPYALRYRVVTLDGLVVSGVQKFTVKN